MLTDQVALVTGASRGIGQAIALALGAQNAVVIGTATSQAGADGISAKLAENDIRGGGLTLDVADSESVAACIKQVTEEYGAPDILVNNAGITRDGMLHKMDQENWQAVIRTNLDSAFNLTRSVIEGMRARGFGRIITISSINGQKGQMGQSNYSAAKAGVIGFTKAVAQENAFKGITANVVAPGYIGTEMVRAVPEEVLKSKILPQIPVGRLGEPEEVARCVTFLAADEAGFITGSTISANGGQYMA